MNCRKRLSKRKEVKEREGTTVKRYCQKRREASGRLINCKRNVRKEAKSQERERTDVKNCQKKNWSKGIEVKELNYGKKILSKEKGSMKGRMKVTSDFSDGNDVRRVKWTVEKIWRNYKNVKYRKSNVENAEKDY